MELQDLIQRELVFSGLEGSSRRSILEELSRRIGQIRPGLDGGELFELLLEREELCSTGIGFGVAIPHCKVAKLEEAVLAVGISSEAIDFSSLDGKPVHTFFVLVSPKDQPALHLRVLSAISRWLKAEPELGANLQTLEPDAIVSYLARSRDAEEVEA